MTERVGDYIETYTGTKFYPLDPRPEEIHIEDIAHALSMMCRYTGHSKYLYTVGHHSFLCMVELLRSGCDEQTQLMALLHDASEAYLTDIPRPLKPHFKQYLVWEKKLQDMIYRKYGLDCNDIARHKRVKEIDNNILSLEAEYLMPSKGKGWNMNITNKMIISEKTNPEWYCFENYYRVKPEFVEMDFLREFRRLVQRVKSNEPKYCFEVGV